MKVLHIVYNLIRGGSEGQCARVVLELARRGWQQEVAVFRREGFFLEEVERVCGPVYRLPIRSFREGSTWRAVRSLAVHIRESGVGVVHAWDMDAAIFGGLGAMLARVPFFTSHRDTGEIYPWYKLILRAFIDRLASVVTANCHAAAESIRWRKWLKREVVVIPNIFDLSGFDVEAREIFSRQEMVPRGWNAVCVSRLDPEKDIACAIEAVGRHWVTEAGKTENEKGTGINLVIAGDGRLRPDLENLAAQWSLNGRVVFLGEITDVPALLKHCMAGLMLPRSNEGLSNAIMEYMAAGLPVIATDCGGNAQLVEHGVNGWLVPPRAPGVVYRYLEHLYRNREAATAMGQSGRKKVQAFVPEKIIPRFEALYREAGSQTVAGP